MSAVTAVPELIARAATDLTTIASTLDAAHLAAAAPTGSVLPAAADEVSAGIAQLFARHGQEYQGLAGKVEQYQQQFVQHLTSAAGAYGTAEAANASLLAPAAAAAAGLPSLDQLLADVGPILFQALAYAYYALFLLLIPIYGALLLYLPLAFAGSLLGI